MMKLILMGHRGVGKTQLLSRIPKYRPGEKVLTYSLDQEISQLRGQSLGEIFASGTEEKFRNIEDQVFQKIVTSLEAQVNSVVLDVGAGFKAEVPKQWKVLWVQRAIDSSRSQFLNRPPLDSSFQLNPLRFRERENRYASLCHYELELLEHRGSFCPYEERFFHQLFEMESRPRSSSLNPSPKEESASWKPLSTQKVFGNPWVTILDQKSSLSRFLLLKKLLDCGVELRDDLLDGENLNFWSQNFFKKIISLRKKKVREKTLSLIEELKFSGSTQVLWDWPLEWGLEKAPIVSLHQRKESLLETLKLSEKVSGVCKVAVVVSNFKDLKIGWDWAQEDLNRRVFLPRSPTGRWKWFRLLQSHQSALFYFRLGRRGSCGDQPSLLEVLRWNKNLKHWAALLGQPVSHSLSPWFHDSFFKKNQANVLSVDLFGEEWEQALDFMRGVGLRWAAVTSPLKRKARQSCKKVFSSRCSDPSLWKDLNTLLWTDRGWIGTPTDPWGLDFLASAIRDESVAVWGGGGVLEALHGVLPQCVFYSSRWGQVRGEKGGLESFEGNQGPDHIIWAVGGESFRKTGQFPPSHWTPKKVFDINYTQDSPGLECAYNYGCEYISGFGIFKKQAIKQQEFWEKYGV